MKKIFKSQKGFTIIELIIYLGIFPIVLLTLTQVFGLVLDTLSESQAKSSILQDSEYVVSRLSYDIRRADQVLLPANLGEEGASLQISMDGENYLYSLNDSNLQLTNDSGSELLNGYDTIVSDLKFTRLGNQEGKDTISLSFTITSKTLYRGRPEAKTFQTTFGLR
jgi:type II secretory pathway pseudopilin PulG